MKAVIDIETGGGSKYKNPICEVAMIIIGDNDFEPVSMFTALVKPYQPISGEMEYNKYAMDIHGITREEMESRGRNSCDVARYLCGLIDCFGVETLIGHNIKAFDYPFLKQFIHQNYMFGDTIWDSLKIEDTMSIAREMGVYEKLSLKYVCEQDGIPFSNSHRALDDATATLEWYLDKKTPIVI